MTRTLTLAGLIVAVAGLAVAQKFEIADIHASEIPFGGGNIFMTGGLMRSGQYELRNATMLDLIRAAYNLDPDKVVGGPSWLETDHFDVVAKPSAHPTAETLRLMLRTLLAERFSLKAHDDKRTFPAYSLSAGKAPKLTRSEGGEAGCKSQIEKVDNPPLGALTGIDAVRLRKHDLQVYTCRAMTMGAFANEIHTSQRVFFGGNAVVDQTGLQGAWDFTFKVSTWAGMGGEIITGVDGITPFDAMEKQLGLKLELSKLPVPVIVVESVNQQPTANAPEVSKLLPRPTKFESAELKPADPGERMQPGPPPFGQVVYTAYPLGALVRQAWRLSGALTGAPPWMDSMHVDITAKAADSAIVEGQAGNGIDNDTMCLMLRNLISERLKISVHREEKQMYAETLVAVAPKMAKADPANHSSCRGNGMMDKPANPARPRVIICQNTTMAQFASQLHGMVPGYIDHDVADATKLTDAYDFTVNFTPAGGANPQPGEAIAVRTPGQPDTGPITLPQALEQQLGLRLEMQRHAVTMIVVDSADQKPPFN